MADPAALPVPRASANGCVGLLVLGRVVVGAMRPRRRGVGMRDPQPEVERRRRPHRVRQGLGVEVLRRVLGDQAGLLAQVLEPRRVMQYDVM